MEREALSAWNNAVLVGERVPAEGGVTIRINQV